MKYWRVGPSYRAAFESSCRWVFLGLIPASAPTSAPPRIITLKVHQDGTPPRVDQARVLDAVAQGVLDAAAETGVTVHLDAIEYIPNDSPYYERYYAHAFNLARWIATGLEPASPASENKAGE